MSSTTDQLEKLMMMLDRGLITREEFDQQKRSLLSRRPAASSSQPEFVGSYRIIGELGRGGMGSVFRGRHKSETFAARHGGDVAIKMLHPQFASRPEIVGRFQREAEMGIKLEHPGIVRALELIIDSGRVALVMELVDGQPMNDLIGTVTGPIPWPRAEPLFQQLLDAVGFAHSKGVVHRDLKPENVIVGESGQIKVLDFGIAKDLSSDRTKTGTGMGTVHYMAPEQYTDAKAVDQRADIYALGMTLFEIVAGRLPWDPSVTDFGILEMKKSGEFPPPTAFYPDIPPHVVAAIAAATSIDIGARFASTDDFARALRAPASATAPPPTQIMAAWSPTEPEPSPPRSTAHAAAPWEPEIAHPPSVQAVPEEPSPPPIDTHSPRSAPPPRSRGPLIAILAVAMIGALVLVIGALVALQSGDRSKASKSRDDDKAQEQDDRAQEQDGASPTPGAPCEGGSAARCTELGRAYQDGAQGRPVDLVKAAELYTEACSRDHTLGCYNLGKLYKEGQGVTLSYSRARDLFERVCQAGEMMGCNNLGTLYRDGQGVSQSASRAAELFSMACSRQNARACYNMAGMWKLQASYNGRGRGQNPGLYCMHGECDCRIFEHYRLACDYQYDKGCTRYRELVGDLGWCEGPSDW